MWVDRKCDIRADQGSLIHTTYDLWSFDRARVAAISVALELHWAIGLMSYARDVSALVLASAGSLEGPSARQRRRGRRLWWGLDGRRRFHGWHRLVLLRSILNEWRERCIFFRRAAGRLLGQQRT